MAAEINAKILNAFPFLSLGHLKQNYSLGLNMYTALPGTPASTLQRTNNIETRVLLVNRGTVTLHTTRTY